jgi:hypothetical protein
MPTLYTGTTESGKTTLARYISRMIDGEKFDVIVRDPVEFTATKGGGWNENATIYNDDDEFFARIERNIAENRPAYIYIDEAADLFSLSTPENFWLATRGRHYGLDVSFITQRPKLIAPSVRAQCNKIYMFRLARQDAREVLADCGHDVDLMDSPLDRGDFLALETATSKFTRSNVFKILDNGKKAV